MRVLPPNHHHTTTSLTGRETPWTPGHILATHAYYLLATSPQQAQNSQGGTSSPSRYALVSTRLLFFPSRIPPLGTLGSNGQAAGTEPAFLSGLSPRARSDPALLSLVRRAAFPPLRAGSTGRGGGRGFQVGGCQSHRQGAPSGGAHDSTLREPGGSRGAPRDPNR